MEPSQVARNLSRRRRLAYTLLAMVLVSVMALVAGEALLRVYVALRGWTPNVYAPALRLFASHPELGNDLAAGFRMRSGVLQVSVNSLGLRGPEIQQQKPPGVQRIAILGGSSVFGYLTSDHEVSSRQLEQILRRDGHRVQVINGGVPGNNLYQTRRRYQVLIEPLQPDIVVLYLGFNDLPYIVSETPQDSRFQIRRPFSWRERLLGHSTLYGFVFYRLLGQPTQLAPQQRESLRPTDAGAAQFRRNLRRLADQIRASGARLVVCSQAMAAHPDVGPELRAAVARDPHNVDAMVQLAQWVRDELERLAREREAVFVDAYHGLEPRAELLGDYIHLTAEGHRQLAELLASSLEPLL